MASVHILRPRRTTAPFWRAVCSQPGHTRFFCSQPFQASSESEALTYAVWLTQRPRQEIEVEIVSAPGARGGRT
jgi:hypothetical protein